MRRLALIVLPGLFGLGLSVAPARADEVLLTSVVGTRVIVTAAVPALVPGVASAVSTVVTETLAPGNNSWSVTIEACAPNDHTTPTAADCATQGLVNADADVIAESALTVSGRAVTPVGAGAGVTATAPAPAATLDSTPALFTSSGQAEDGSTYNGVYTATANLTLNPPGGTVAGVYKGYLVVTLVE